MHKHAKSAVYNTTLGDWGIAWKGSQNEIDLILAG